MSRSARTRCSSPSSPRYYTDADVRAAIGYPGQVVKPVTAFDYPAYIQEGLIDRVLERGPIWRDPDDVSTARPATGEGG